MLRFSYGLSSSPINITVERFTARTIEGTIVCGPRRREKGVLDTFEILHCTEVFVSTLLHELLTQVKSAEWIEGDKSKTRRINEPTPRLNPQFTVPQNEKHKRI